MELTRKQVIKELKAILEMDYKNVPLSKAALEYAISSLKTDEAYQIMYEGGEIFTKDDLVVMLTELKSEMNLIKECEQQIYGKEEWNFVGKCQDAIQQKIDNLKGEQK